MLLAETLTEIDVTRALGTLRSAVNNLNRAEIERSQLSEDADKSEATADVQSGRTIQIFPPLITRRTPLTLVAARLARQPGSFETIITTLQDVRDEGTRAQAIAFIAGGCMQADAELKRKQRETENQRAAQRNKVTPTPRN